MNGNDTLEVQRPGKPKATQLRVLSEPIRIWRGSEKKEKLNLSVVSGSKERPISMVKRSLGFGLPADKYILLWRRLKKFGIATIPTVRKLSDHEVLVTDLTADGSKLYGKEEKKDALYGTWGAVEEVDDILTRISLSDIATRASSLVEQANIAGFLLARDDPFKIMVRPDGSWDVGVFDFSMARLDTDVGMNAERVVRFNSSDDQVGFLLDCVQTIRTTILDKQKNGKPWK